MILQSVQPNLPKTDSQKGSVLSDLRNHGLANAKQEPFSNFLHSKPSNRQPDWKLTPKELATEEKTVTPRAKVKKQPKLDEVPEVVSSDKPADVSPKLTGEKKTDDQGEKKAVQTPFRGKSGTKRLANADNSSVATAVVLEKAGSEKSPVEVRAGKRTEVKERGIDVEPLLQVSDKAKKSENSKFSQSSTFDVADKKVQPKVDRVESKIVGELQHKTTASGSVGTETSTALQKTGSEVGVGGNAASDNKVSENRSVNDLHSKDSIRNHLKERRLAPGEVAEPILNSKPAKTRAEKPEVVLLSSEQNKDRLSQTRTPSEPMPLPRGLKSVAHELVASRDVYNNGGKQNGFEKPANMALPSPINTPTKIQADLEGSTEAKRAAHGGRNLGNSGVETSRSQSPKQSGELTLSTGRGDEKTSSTILNGEERPANLTKEASTLRAVQKQTNLIEVNGSRLGSYDRTANQQKGQGALPRLNLQGSASPDTEELNLQNESKVSTNETRVAASHSKSKANSLLGLATSRESSQIAESLKRSEENLLVGDRRVNKPLKPSNPSEPTKIAVRDGEKPSQVIANQLAGVSSIIKQIPVRKVSLKQANLAKRPTQPSVQAKQQNKNSVPPGLVQARTESGGIEAAFKGNDMLLAQDSELNGNPQKQEMFLRDRLPSLKSTESYAGTMSDPVKLGQSEPHSHRDISVRGDLVNRIAQASAELESVQGKLTQTKGQAASTAIIYREIMSTVESFRAMSSSRWSMNLEPIENLRMQLDLRMSDSQLVVQARVDRAGHALLSTGWGELQQLLSEKDVDLKSLTSQSHKEGAGTKFDSQDGRQSGQQKEKDESFLGKELSEFLAEFEKETHQPRKAGRAKGKARMAETTFDIWA